MIKLKFVSLAVITVGFLSCDRNRVFDQYQTVSETWEKEEKVSFVIPKLDSTKTYNLFINIRNNNAYKFSNLFLISEMKFPNGKVITDTLEYEMASPDGKWLGSGFTDLKENKLWYKENVAFKEDGEYIFTVEHAMRKNGEVEGINSLEGISDIGFRIESTKNP